MALDGHRPYQTLLTCRLGGSIKKSKFSESQLVAILKEGEAGVAVTELIHKHGITSTYYNWKSKYAGVEVSGLKRMKELEIENAKLKRMNAELALEKSRTYQILCKQWDGPPRFWGLSSYMVAPCWTAARRGGRPSCSLRYSVSTLARPGSISLA